MYLSKKIYHLLGASTLAIPFFFLKPSHALQETAETRALIAQGLEINNVDAIRLQQQAVLATTDLNGSTSRDTIHTLPAAVSSVNAALDGVQHLTNLTNFTVTTAATNSAGTISMGGNDGSPSQTYSVTYSSPIAPGATFILTNGSKSITFVNNSGGSLSSASALATYLSGAYPVNFLISNTTLSKITALGTILGGTNGGASGTNTSLYGQAITVTSAAPTNNTVNNLLDGVQSVSGLTSFTVTTAATNSAGTISMGGNDGSPSQTYSVTYSSSIASGAPFTLTNAGSGNTITFANNSGGSLSSAGALATYLATSYPVNAVISDTTANKATALKTFLGGTGSSAMGSAAALDASLLSTPTGNLTTDVATLAAEVVTSPSGVLETDVYTINSLLNGTSTGSTTQGRIGSPTVNSLASNLSAVIGTSGSSLAAQLGDPSNMASIDAQIGVNVAGSGSPSSIAAKLGNTGAGNSSIGSLLGSSTIPLYTQIVGNSGLLKKIDGTTTDSGNVGSRLTTQITALESGATQLSAAISDVNTALGGSGTTQTRVYGVNASLDGVRGFSGLTRFTVTTPATNSAGTVSMIGNDGSPGRTYSVTYSSSIASGAPFTLTNAGSGNTITFVNNSGSSITSASALATYLASAYPVNAVLSNSTTSKTTTVQTNLGGPNYSVLGNVLSLGALIGTPTGTSTDSLSTQVGTPQLNGSQSDLAAVLGGTQGAGISLATLLGDPGSGTIIDNIGGSTTSVQAALNAVSTTLVNNTNFSSSLATQATTLSTTLDNGLSSLPDGNTYATVGTAATSDGSGGVNIVISAGAPGTYNLPSSTITGSIGNGSPFTLINGSNNIVLYNRSGATITTQDQAIHYLASMYPVSSKIVSGISDKTASLNTMIGGSASSVRARLAGVDKTLLNTPTGVIATDLATFRGKMVTSPGVTAEADVETNNSLLDGNASGSTTQERIGVPTVNGSSSNLSAVIGSSETSIADRLGDPVTGTTGLASLIRNNGTSLGTVNGIDCSAFDNASTYYDQLGAVLSILSSMPGSLTVTVPPGGFTSLRNFLAALNQSA